MGVLSQIRWAYEDAFDNLGEESDEALRAALYQLAAIENAVRDELDRRGQA